MLFYWALIQVGAGLVGLLGEESGGVAVWAHAGGFVAGAALIKLFARPRDVSERQSHHWEPRRVAARW